MSIVLAIVLGASAFDETFDLGLEHYEAKNYAIAIAQFEQLVAQRVEDPSVFYNLGNAYYRSGRLAPAIANYERALRLDPGFENAQENLDRCIKQSVRGLSKPQPPELEQNLLFWHYHLRRGTSFGLAALSWCLFWTLLAVRQIRTWPYLRRCAAVAAVAAMAFGASWWVKSSPQTLAVATHVRVPVHYGMNETETVRFELFEGDRVRVDRREGEWARVETGSGERGWVRASSLVFVGPPYEAPPPYRPAVADLEALDGQGDSLQELGYID